MTEPIGLRIIMQRSKSGAVKLILPEWITSHWGALLVLNFDGAELSITSPPEADGDPIMTLH